MIEFPDIHIYQYDTSEIASPSGTRHIEGGSFAFLRRVGLGCANYGDVGTSGVLDFGPVIVDLANPQSSFVSDVTAITFRLATSGTGVSSLRLHLSDNTALTQPAADVGVPSAFIQIATSGGTWQPNPLLPSGAGTQLTTSVPATNVLRQDGANFMAELQDGDASEFVYMNLVVPIDFPTGDYGVCGSGLLRFNLLFDYWDSEQFLQFGGP